MTSGEVPRKLSVGIWCVLVGSAVLTGLSMWTYVGPYRWVVELQMLVSGGSYEAKLSLVLTWIVIVVPLWLILTLIGRLIPTRPIIDESIDFDALEGGRPSTASGRIPSVAPTKAPSKSVMLSGVGLTVGIIVLGIGAVLWWHGASLGGLTHAAVAELEAGKKPESGYLEIEGLALWDYAPSFKEQYTETYYCPLVSQEWRPPKPVAVYLASHYKLSRNPFDKSTPKFTGIRSLEGMPGPVRAGFEQGDFKPAGDFILLSLGESPEGYVFGGRLLSVIGGGVTLLSLLALTLIRLRRPAPAT